MAFTVNIADLTRILSDIKIAEAHTAGANLTDLINSPLMPFGLRTVDGSFNNLLPNNENYGAADQVMPRLLNPYYLNDNDGDAIVLGPGAPLVQGDYHHTSGNVVDADPRIISNLIADQSVNNPAAIVSALVVAGVDDPFNKAGEITTLNNAVIAAYEDYEAVLALNGGDEENPDVVAALAVADGLAQDMVDTATGLGLQFDLNTKSIVIPNVAPDEGLTAPVNSWMTLFGQFFDHGLDLIPKGGQGTVYIPLQPDDPLYVEGSNTNFMVVTRATTDENGEVTNKTTPFVDQNQTYTSHASHQVFLREYFMHEGRPMNTGHLLEGVNGGMSTWADVKEQARTMLGIQLTDLDVHNVPLLATDEYGNFERGPNGFPMVVTSGGLVEGDPSANGGLGISLANAVRTGHAFIDDIAHNAAPGFVDHDRNPATDPILKTADTDSDTGNIIPLNQFGQATTYDNELLDRHFMAGDGRANENIGLTAVHHVFHSEHNRLVEDYKQTILDNAIATNDLSFLNEWLLDPVASMPADIGNVVWNGERLFQAGRWVTEMQYQHLVFEEFGRTIQPGIDVFLFSNTADINPAIFAEFAHVVYRFGHSMLTETVDRYNQGDTSLEGDHIDLITAFLNPVEYDKDGGVTADQAAGAIVRGMTSQVANELDEFVTEALRNNLVGLPLDLAAINIARARETGVPTLNMAREQFFEISNGDSMLRPYTSWLDFALNLKNPASVINFIAAYGTHSTITSAGTAEEKRAAATLLVLGGEDAPADRVAFLNATGAYAFVEGVNEALGGLNNVDFWIGGLAEKIMPFGGMLGSTFNFVFEAQMEALQEGDRFYYLSRTQGMNMINQLEANSFAALIMRNTDLGEGNAPHLPGQVFRTPAYTFEINQALEAPDQVDPLHDDPVLAAMGESLVVRGQNFLQYNGGDHVVLGGTNDNDTIIGGEGDDSLWGDNGNDRLEGGYGMDTIFGGAGDDIITDAGDIDMLKGEGGNDVIHAGNGIGDLVFGGEGNDFLIGGQDEKTLFGGQGDDFILGSAGMSTNMGNEGDDWIEGGDNFDTLAGDNSELFFNSKIIGHDVLDGKGNDTDYDGESGDDIMVQGPGIQRNNGMAGFDWTIHKGDPNGANSDLGIPIFVNQEAVILRDRFDLVEGLSGWVHDDILTGRQVVTGANGIGGAAAQFKPTDPWESFSNALLQSSVDRIDGFDELVAHLDTVTLHWNNEVHQVYVMDEAAVSRTAPGASTATFVSDTAADILLGGGGSDTFMGKSGNDIIDGDRWLNVRIAVSGVDGFPAATADSLNGQVYDNVTKAVLFGGRSLDSMMLDRTLTPGQLSIVREILDGGQTGDIDTAIYRGNRADYVVTNDGAGTWTVAHTPLDGVIDEGNNGTFDGTDTLRNIERLQFADMTITIGGTNGAPEVVQPGFDLLVISDTTPTEDQTLTALVNFSDPDDIVAGTLTFTWQMLQAAEGGGGLWVDVGTGQTFSPGDAQVGNALRVVASYVDGAGFNETVTSAPTVAVANINDSPVGEVVIDDLTPVVTQTINVSHALTDADGMGAVSYQWQSSLNGVTWTNIDGATGSSYTANTVGVQLRVAASYLDGQGTSETVFSVPVTSIVAAYNIIEGGAGNDPLSGTALPDMMLGHGGNDTLSGGDGDDVLDGGAGNDVMLGGAGNDTYVVDSVGDMVVELANGGTDTVQTSLNGYTLGENVENLVLTGSGNIHGVGNSLDNLMVGNAGDNLLQGRAGNDTLLGNSGSDTLNGGVGDDVMEGGGGNDLYWVHDAGDVVIEHAGGGIDEVRTSVLSSWTLSEHVEDLRYLGTQDFTGTGNAENNRIWGNTGNDTLDGGAGADTMRGGLGNDTYYVDDVGDRVSDVSDGGIDTVISSISFSLGGNFENLIYTGDVGATLSGSGRDNYIRGGVGDDDIRGGAGADTLEGGAGNDTMRGGAGDDVFVFAAGSGHDTIFGFDANPGGGQDLLDISAFGISAATFVGSVSINQVGSDTLVGFDTSTITLVGVNSANVTQQDFILA